MRKLNEIILHCSATEEGKDFTVDDIRKWHVQGNGWKNIGYHYVIYRDGTIHEGRPIEQVGAHTKGHNSNSIGICYVGGVAADRKTPKDTRTPQQKEAMLTLVRLLMKAYGITKVTGHCEYAAKSCPSFHVRQWREENGI